MKRQLFVQFCKTCFGFIIHHQLLIQSKGLISRTSIFTIADVDSKSYRFRFPEVQLQTGKFIFCVRKKFFTVKSARLEKLPPPSPPHMGWDIFKYILQILRVSLAVARIAVFLRSEDLQRPLHTFQCGRSLTIKLTMRMKIMIDISSFTLF